MPLRRVILSRTPMRVSYALEVFDASAIVLRLWWMVREGVFVAFAAYASSVVDRR